MKIKIAIAIPNRILSPNHTVGSRGGRMAKAGAIKKARNTARLAFLIAYAVGYKPRFKRASVQVYWFTKTIVHPDGDNAIATLKSSFDGLTDAGLFDDDRGLTHQPVIFAKDAKNPRVEIEVTPL